MSGAGMTIRDLLYRCTAPAAAALVEEMPDQAVRCLACGHRCVIRPDKHGVCMMRFNRNGQLRVPWGYVSSLAIDPIEKKPFYHAFPGREALSLGMLGCNFHCPFCQNWLTSQTLRDQRAVAEPRTVSPERIVELAVENRCPVITSTYNEPLITIEWAVEIFRQAREHGICGSLVSNGHATPEVLEFIRPCVQLYKVDLKSFSEKTYRTLGGSLQVVLDTIRRLHELDFWVEVVTLVVPGVNDDEQELRQIAEFLAGVSVDIPWHVTAFRPDYKLTDQPRTPAEKLMRAWEIGRESGLRYVYAGNLPGMVGRCENTFCPQCEAELIVRRGFMVLENRLVEGRCPQCRTEIAGVWQTPAELRADKNPDAR